MESGREPKQPKLGFRESLLERESLIKSNIQLLQARTNLSDEDKKQLSALEVKLGLLQRKIIRLRYFIDAVDGKNDIPHVDVNSIKYTEEEYKKAAQTAEKSPGLDLMTKIEPILKENRKKQIADIENEFIELNKNLEVLSKLEDKSTSKPDTEKQAKKPIEKLDLVSFLIECLRDSSIENIVRASCRCEQAFAALPSNITSNSNIQFIQNTFIFLRDPSVEAWVKLYNDYLRPMRTSLVYWLNITPPIEKQLHELLKVTDKADASAISNEALEKLFQDKDFIAKFTELFNAAMPDLIKNVTPEDDFVVVLTNLARRNPKIPRDTSEKDEFINEVSAILSKKDFTLGEEKFTEKKDDKDSTYSDKLFYGLQSALSTVAEFVLPVFDEEQLKRGDELVKESFEVDRQLLAKWKEENVTPEKIGHLGVGPQIVAKADMDIVNSQFKKIKSAKQPKLESIFDKMRKQGIVYHLQWQAIKALSPEFESKLIKKMQALGPNQVYEYQKRIQTIKEIDIFTVLDDLYKLAQKPGKDEQEKKRIKEEIKQKIIEYYGSLELLKETIAELGIRHDEMNIEALELWHKAHYAHQMLIYDAFDESKLERFKAKNSNELEPYLNALKKDHASKVSSKKPKPKEKEKEKQIPTTWASLKHTIEAISRTIAANKYFSIGGIRDDNIDTFYKSYNINPNKLSAEITQLTDTLQQAIQFGEGYLKAEAELKPKLDSLVAKLASLEGQQALLIKTVDTDIANNRSEILKLNMEIDSLITSNEDFKELERKIAETEESKEPGWGEKTDEYRSKLSTLRETLKEQENVKALQLKLDALNAKSSQLEQQKKDFIKDDAGYHALEQDKAETREEIQSIQKQLLASQEPFESLIEKFPEFGLKKLTGTTEKINAFPVIRADFITKLKREIDSLNQIELVNKLHYAMGKFIDLFAKEKQPQLFARFLSHCQQFIEANKARIDSDLLTKFSWLQFNGEGKLIISGDSEKSKNQIKIINGLIRVLFNIALNPNQVEKAKFETFLSRIENPMQEPTKEVKAAESLTSSPVPPTVATARPAVSAPTSSIDVSISPAVAQPAAVKATETEVKPTATDFFVPFKMIYKNDSQPDGKDTKDQAQHIFAKMIEFSKKSDTETRPVGITYSANHQQTLALKAYYENTDDSKSDELWQRVLKEFSGSAGQGAVMQVFLQELAKAENAALRKQFRILPISTMDYEEGKAKPSQNAWLKEDLENIAAFAKTGLVLGWQNQDANDNKDSKFAVGGGIAKDNFSPSQNTYIQEYLDKFRSASTSNSAIPLIDSLEELQAKKQLSRVVDELLNSEVQFHTDMKQLLDHFFGVDGKLKADGNYLTEAYIQVTKDEGLTPQEKIDLTNLIVKFKPFLDNPFSGCMSAKTTVDKLTCIAKIIEDEDPASKFNQMFSAFSSATDLQKDATEFNEKIGKDNFKLLNGLYVNAYVIKPVQRALKFPLLLREMMEALKKISTMDTKILDKSDSIIKKKADELNEAQRLYDEINKLIEPIAKHIAVKAKSDLDDNKKFLLGVIIKQFKIMIKTGNVNDALKMLKAEIAKPESYLKHGDSTALELVKNLYVHAQLYTIEKQQQNGKDCHIELHEFITNPENRRIMAEDAKDIRKKQAKDPADKSKSIKEYFFELSERSVELLADSLITKDRELWANLDTYGLYLDTTKEHKDEKDKAKVQNILQVVEYGTNVTHFVVNDILARKNIDERTLALEYWLKVADRCLHHPTQPDFGMAIAIYAVTQKDSIHRLKATFNGLSEQAKSIIEELANLQAKNSKDLRNKLTRTPHAVPFLGMYKSDFTFAKEGNTHIEKFTTLASAYQMHLDVRERIEAMQQVDFSKHESPALVFSPFDADEAFKESLALEPRGEVIKKSELNIQIEDSYKQLKGSTLPKPIVSKAEISAPSLDEAENVLFIVAEDDLPKGLLAIDDSITIQTSKDILATYSKDSKDVPDKKSQLDFVSKELAAYNTSHKEEPFEQGYLFTQYVRDIFNNQQYHLDHEKELVDEPPIRKAIAALYLMLKQPEFFAPHAENKEDKNRVDLVILFLKLLSTKDLQKITDFMQTLDAKELQAIADILKKNDKTDEKVNDKLPVFMSELEKLIKGPVAPKADEEKVSAETKAAPVEPAVKKPKTEVEAPAKKEEEEKPRAEAEPTPSGWQPAEVSARAIVNVAQPEPTKEQKDLKKLVEEKAKELEKDKEALQMQVKAIEEAKKKEQELTRKKNELSTEIDNFNIRQTELMRIYGKHNVDVNLKIEDVLKDFLVTASSGASPIRSIIENSITDASIVVPDEMNFKFNKLKTLFAKREIRSLIGQYEQYVHERNDLDKKLEPHKATAPDLYAKWNGLKSLHAGEMSPSFQNLLFIRDWLARVEKKSELEKTRTSSLHVSSSSPGTSPIGSAPLSSAPSLIPSGPALIPVTDDDHPLAEDLEEDSPALIPKGAHPPSGSPAPIPGAPHPAPGAPVIPVAVPVVHPAPGAPSLFPPAAHPPAPGSAAAKGYVALNRQMAALMGSQSREKLIHDEVAKHFHDYMDAANHLSKAIGRAANSNSGIPKLPGLIKDYKLIHDSIEVFVKLGIQDSKKLDAANLALKIAQADLKKYQHTTKASAMIYYSTDREVHHINPANPTSAKSIAIQSAKQAKDFVDDASPVTSTPPSISFAKSVKTKALADVYVDLMDFDKFKAAAVLSEEDGVLANKLYLPPALSLENKDKYLLKLWARMVVQSLIDKMTPSEKEKGIDIKYFRSAEQIHAIEVACVGEEIRYHNKTGIKVHLSKQEQDPKEVQKSYAQLDTKLAAKMGSDETFITPAKVQKTIERIENLNKVIAKKQGFHP